MAAGLVLPRVLVMVLCDQAETVGDEQGVVNLLGVRTQISPADLPHVHPQFWVYLQMTGHPGQFNYHLEVVEAAHDTVIHITPTQRVELFGPLEIVVASFVLTNCCFRSAGLHYVQAFCDDHLICERPLHILDTRFRTNGTQVQG